MKFCFDLAVEYVKSRLFGPKEYFERQKQRLVRAMILPLFVLVGGPSLIVSVLSSFRYINFQGQGVMLQLVGEASTDVIVLASTVVLTFCFALGANLLYGVRIRKTQEQLQSIEDKHKLDSSFEELKTSYYNALNDQHCEKALALGSYICKAYPQHARLEPDFIKSLVDNGIRLDLLSGDFSERSVLRFPSREGDAVE